MNMIDDLKLMAEQASMGLCPFCGEERGEYRDEESRKESEISGLCQSCQDDFFDEQDHWIDENGDEQFDDD